MSRVVADAGDRARVVVVHDDPSVAASVAAAVLSAGLAPWSTTSPRGALFAFHPALPSTPVAVVVDVGIDDPYVFEFIDAVRAAAQPSTTFVVTVGAVHNPARYRRRPSSLHGADAHVDAPAVARDLPSLLAPLASSLVCSPCRRRLTDWALDHRLAVAATLTAGRPASSVGGEARVALEALAAACVDDAGFSALLARLDDAFARSHAAGRPFG